MSNSNYYAVCAADLRKLREMNAVFAHGIPLACPRVNDYRLYSVFAEPSDNIVHLTVSGIGAILLKCKTENDYLRFFRSLSCLNHLFDSGIRDKSSHAVVDNTSVEYYLTVIPELFRFVCKIIRINADAMTADKSGAEAERIPLRIHSVNDLVCVDAHTVEYHGKLIHKRNIYISLAVLNDLDRLGGLDGRYRICSDLYHDIIYLFDDIERFLIHTRNDLAYILEAMNLVAGMNIRP